MTTVLLPSPIGTLTVVGDHCTLREIRLPHQHGGAAIGTAEPTVPLTTLPPGALSATVRQLEEYFARERKEFDLPIELAGTPFQREVWQSLADIPYGETVSYAELATMVGRPRAFRAVGQANGANPIPIVLPCHRVVASGGGIGGYGGGLEMKRQLLALEGVAA